ncbi:hypothetical protein [Spirillospora sp. CA-294931]|uniref:hypothetical protein n=1 Tax=Spirillospora sp. CA-294931 TaxID=3240042 RepID=UPI003D8CE063
MHGRLRGAGAALAFVLAAGTLGSCGGESADVRAVAGGTRAPEKAFAVVKPGANPSEVVLARAVRQQPGGPETLVPARLQRETRAPLAPGAVINVTAPIHLGELGDWLKGVPVSPAEFARLSREADRRLAPMPGRARMFDVWLDERGRVTRMHQIFSP